jgi:hypothetical protein
VKCVQIPFTITAHAATFATIIVRLTCPQPQHCSYQGLQQLTWSSDRRAAAAAGPARQRTELAQALARDLLLGVDQVELPAGVPQGLRVHAKRDLLW